MVTYKYKAISRDGLPVSGIVEAYDEYAAVAQIKETCSLVTRITPVRERSGLLTKEINVKKIDLKALSMVCSQFSVILAAGMPIAKCVGLIAGQSEDKRLKRILSNVARDVAAGYGLADSFETAGKGVLPLTFIETVRSGEQSGTLENSFESLSGFYERRYKTKQKVSAALTYPVFVMIIAVVVMIVVMVKVIPTVSGIFDELGGDMPPSTKALISVSAFFQKHILWILLGMLLLTALSVAAVRTEEGRVKWNRLKLKVPILGKISMLNASSQFANTMSTLLGAGLPVARALAVTAKTLDNYMLSLETSKMVTGLEEGRHLGTCMKECGCYPQTLNDMCVIGEETGELEETLKTIGRYFDNEAEHATQKALSKLEPAILVLIAGIAGFIVISIYLPIFNIYDMM